MTRETAAVSAAGVACCRRRLRCRCCYCCCPTGDPGASKSPGRDREARRPALREEQRKKTQMGRTQTQQKRTTILFALTRYPRHAPRPHTTHPHHPPAAAAAAAAARGGRAWGVAGVACQQREKTRAAGWLAHLKTGRAMRRRSSRRSERGRPRRRRASASCGPSRGFPPAAPSTGRRQFLRRRRRRCPQPPPRRPSF